MLCRFELFLAITSALAAPSSSTVVKPSDQWLLQSCHLLGGAPTPAHSCVCLGFPGGSAGKESACNTGDPGSIPGLGRSPGDGNGYPLQYSYLENSMDRGAWWATILGVAKSWTRLNVLNVTEHFSVQFRCSIVSDSLEPRGLQHTRLPYHQFPEIAQTHVH